MRISRLDLTRYGCFKNQPIAFKNKQAGKPDLHIIYGRNEAGKSTLLNAYIDLLFGIGGQSPFNFQHPYNTRAFKRKQLLVFDCLAGDRAYQSRHLLCDDYGRRYDFSRTLVTLNHEQRAAVVGNRVDRDERY